MIWELLLSAIMFSVGYVFAGLNSKGPRKGDRFTCDNCHALNQVSAVKAMVYSSECGRCGHPKEIRL